MKLQWLGHSCFLIIAENGTRIITDPFDATAYSGALKYRSLDGIEADIVTISHMSHPDHNYFEAIGGKRRLVRKAGEKDIEGIHFFGVNSFHDEAKGSERGMNTIFIIEVDGVRICHLGDLGHTLTEGNIRGMGHVDLLLIPVGGTFTIDSGQAEHVANTVKPSIVIPMHYRNERCHFHIDGVGPFLAGRENVHHKPSQVTITKDTLPVETETWVLDVPK